jgi:hypothetical protein
MKNNTQIFNFTMTHINQYHQMVLKLFPQMKFMDLKNRSHQQPSLIKVITPSDIDEMWLSKFHLTVQ